MVVCPLHCWILNFLNKSQKWLFLLIFWSSQTFYPNWPIVLHGYIRHIRDILQLWHIHTLLLKLSSASVPASWSVSSIFSIHCPPATYMLYVICYQHILYTGPIYNILNTSTSHSGDIWAMNRLRLSSVQSEAKRVYSRVPSHFTGRNGPRKNQL